MIHSSERRQAILSKKQKPGKMSQETSIFEYISYWRTTEKLNNLSLSYS